MESVNKWFAGTSDHIDRQAADTTKYQGQTPSTSTKGKNQVLSTKGKDQVLSTKGKHQVSKVKTR